MRGAVGTALILCWLRAAAADITAQQAAQPAGPFLAELTCTYGRKVAVAEQVPRDACAQSCDLNYYKALQRHCLQEHGARGHESLG